MSQTAAPGTKPGLPTPKTFPKTPKNPTSGKVIKKPSPRKASSTVVPGRKLSNGRFVRVPRGFTMDLLQIKDFEISRLMEEIVDYEEECATLTHQVRRLEADLASSAFKTMEMEQTIKQLHKACATYKLMKYSGPGIQFRPDEKLITQWNALLKDVATFAQTNCNRALLDVKGSLHTKDLLADYVTKGPDGKDIAFRSWMDDPDNGNKNAWFCFNKITNWQPERLDAYLEKGMELVVMAIIMRILVDEIFQKMRFFLRSDPFWEPAMNVKVAEPVVRKNPKDNTDELFQWDGTSSTLVIADIASEDLFIREEVESLISDDSEQSHFLPDSITISEPNTSVITLGAFEYNALRAKMLRHLVTTSAPFRTAFAQQNLRVGCLILDAIDPLLTANNINTDKVKDAEKILKDEENWVEQLQKIVIKAGSLAVLMRMDHTVTYLDPGGFGEKFDPILMENAVEFVNGKERKKEKKETSEKEKEKEKEASENEANLVVSPCLKRAGTECGTNYNQARILAKSLVLVKPSVPETK